jgi:hypothetical protein
MNPHGKEVSGEGLIGLELATDRTLRMRVTDECSRSPRAGGEREGTGAYR